MTAGLQRFTLCYLTMGILLGLVVMVCYAASPDTRERIEMTTGDDPLPEFWVMLFLGSLMVWLWPLPILLWIWANGDDDGPWRG